MKLSSADHQRRNLSRTLVYEASSHRYLVDVENLRVEEVLDEQYVDLSAKRSRVMNSVHGLLERLGLRHPEQPHVTWYSHIEKSQQRHGGIIGDELDRSRELMRAHSIKGIDDVCIDERLKLRTEDCLLPPLFREWHRRGEEEAGESLTFLKWMTDIASDEQLMNVWQWHDAYLRNLDGDPAFAERILAIKASYAMGAEQAVNDKALHSDMVVSQTMMQDMRIVHGSPFSPLLAFADAYADKGIYTIQVREGVDDFTLYHEMTHLLKAGLYPEYDEATTDLIAAEIYNRNHPGREVDLQHCVYADQIATLKAIERITGGKVGVYELSRFYAGPDRESNMVLLMQYIDAASGLPISVPLLGEVRKATERIKGAYG